MALLKGKVTIRQAVARVGWLLLLLGLLCLPGAGIADEPGQAALVIQFDDGRVEARCVAFEGDEISGIDLLTTSGLEVVMDGGSGLGVTICQIEGEGCAFPVDPCFCQCMGGAECAYWNYYYRDPGESRWVYSALGAVLRKAKHGSVEAWVWGAGDVPPADELAFEAVCSPPTPTRTPPPTVHATPETPELPVPEAPTPVPTATMVAAATEAPIQTPTSLPAVATARPTPTPILSAIEAGAPRLADYWPFGIMLLGLTGIGLFIWLRRT